MGNTSPIDNDIDAITRAAACTERLLELDKRGNDVSSCVSLIEEALIESEVEAAELKAEEDNQPETQATSIPKRINSNNSSTKPKRHHWGSNGVLMLFGAFVAVATIQHTAEDPKSPLQPFSKSIMVSTSKIIQTAKTNFDFHIP